MFDIRTIEGGDLVKGRVVFLHVSGFGLEELQEVGAPSHPLRERNQLPRNKKFGLVGTKKWDYI